MKKIMAVMITVLLFSLCVTSFAAEYSLPEKMKKQLDIGSGLKGSFSVTASGFQADIPFLELFNRTEFELRGIASDGNLYYCVYQADDSEKQNNKTELFSADGKYYLKSELLNNQLVYIPDLYQAADTITSGENRSTVISSAFVKIAEAITGLQSQEWEKALQPYRDRIELWISRFPVSTDYKTLDGRSCLEMAYDIPYSSMVSFVQEILPDLFRDETVLRLLEQVMTEEQKALFLNPDLVYFYVEAVNQFKTEENIVISKLTDAKTGKAVASHLSLPLNPETTGFEVFMADQQEGGNSTWTLRGNQRMLSLEMPSDLLWDTDFEHEIHFLNLFYDEDQKEPRSTALCIRLSRRSAGPVVSPEDEKTHENYDYKLEIEQDPSLISDKLPAQLASFDTLTADLNIHFSGKNAQQSPTTAELEFRMQIGKKMLGLSGKFKSAAPWVVTVPEAGEGINLLEAREEQREALINRLTENAKNLLHFNPDTSIAGADSSSAPENEVSSPEPETDRMESTETADYSEAD